jgi:antitoxin MazE
VPEALAAQVGLCDGGPAELELAGGRLVVRPGGPATLAELLSGVTPENLHEEWAAGPPAGTELL